MKVHKDVEQRSEEWLQLRKEKITGKRANKVNSSRKDTIEDCFYELLSERLSIDEEEDESDLERGIRLEPEAIRIFAEKTGKKVEVVGFCERDDNEHIAYSPDGLIKHGKKYTENVEAKCLSGKNHLRAYIEQKVPSEHWYQVIQGFVVNDDLEKNHVVFYDPRVLEIPLFYITIERKDVLDDIAISKGKQEEMLKRVDDTIKQLLIANF